MAGPEGLHQPCDMAARPGGILRIVTRAPDGLEHPGTGVVREIVEPERLVFTNVAVDQAGRPVLEGLATVTFAEHGGKTKLTVVTRAVGLVDDAVRMLDGMKEGGHKASNASRAMRCAFMAKLGEGRSAKEVFAREYAEVAQRAVSNGTFLSSSASPVQPQRPLR
jgi:uncharacterized protein YndB with AHSA1/START domain